MADMDPPPPIPPTAWPADQVERRPVAGLIPYARNARTHSESQVAQIAASIHEWGWTTPVLVDEEGVLIAGHGRVLAAQKLGLTSVPTVVARGWSDAQKRAYRLADNKLALNAGWDDTMLRIEMTALGEEGYDLAMMGFSDAELAAIMVNKTEGLTDPEDAPEAPVEPATRAGDVWLLGKHRLVCGDATNAADVAAALAGVQPHLMVTDPPYGVDYDPAWRAAAGVNHNTAKLGVVTNDGRADWAEAWALFPGDVVYVWHAGRYASTVQDSLDSAGYQVRSQIIWAKDRFALSRGDYHWQHEPCWYAVRKGATGRWTGGRAQSTLWQIAARDDKGHGHGTQKPVECMRRPMDNNSSPGQAVYDPFVGSGTTIIAAEMSGRVCHAIEISPPYCDVVVLRWEAFTGEVATLEGDGRSFAEVAQERATPPAQDAGLAPEQPLHGQEEPTQA